jgi:hypothetical protein
VRLWESISYHSSFGLIMLGWGQSCLSCVTQPHECEVEGILCGCTYLLVALTFCVHPHSFHSCRLILHAISDPCEKFYTEVDMVEGSILSVIFIQEEFIALRFT